MSASTRAKAARSLAAILSQPAISPEELYASGLIPVGRNGIYEACGNGERLANRTNDPSGCFTTIPSDSGAPSG